MLDIKTFEEIRVKMAEFDKRREEVIKGSRSVVKLSKQAIYAVHRGDLKGAKGFLDQMKELLNHLDEAVKDYPKLVYSGSFKVAIQEYVEAYCYYDYVAEGRIPSYKELGVGHEYYLLGLCDLTGELVRKAINAAINGDYDSSRKIKELVDEIYGEFLKMDITDGELRKKYDGIKYDLKKLEGMVFDLKMKGK